MPVSYLSPLAPAAGLLLSAFILFGILPYLPARWRARPGVKYLSAPVFVGAAMLTLPAIPVTSGSDVSGEGLLLLSGWNFSTTASVASLTVRVDSLSLPFLIVTFLVLLAVTLLYSDLRDGETGWGIRYRVLAWLVLGAAACALFVSANGLTVAYAVMAFDSIAGFYWLARKQPNPGVGRIFLGVVTAVGLMLTTSASPDGSSVGQHVLGIALWLRLGLYPLIEANTNRHWRDDERLACYGLTLTVGIYLASRVMSFPLPPAIYGLTVITMLLTGGLAWVAGADGSLDFVQNKGYSTEYIRETRTSLATWLILTESLLVLLAAPVTVEIASAFSMGLVLSLAALWVTPALGAPRFSEGAWSWPYLPAIMATVTVIGIPFSLGWLTRAFTYVEILRVDNLPILAPALPAEGLALSGLVYYWRLLIGGREKSMRRSVAGIVVMVPFLTPGLAPFILSTLTQTDLSFSGFELTGGLLFALIVPLILAVGLGYFRAQILVRLGVATGADVTQRRINTMLSWGETLFKIVTKVVLRVQLVLEGQHYISWAIFMALVGTLIILLG